MKGFRETCWPDLSPGGGKGNEGVVQMLQSESNLFVMSTQSDYDSSVIVDEYAVFFGSPCLDRR